MHNGCFGLVRRPFASVPQVEDYFPGTGIENARAALTRCIQRGEGAGLVIGPSGTGKTLLCLMLAKQFRRTFRVAMLPSGRLSTRRALFQAILYELGRPYRGMDEGELRLAVVDDVSVGNGSRSLVLLVDEAHVLPMRLLEELRLLTNLARDGQPLVRLVLAGGSVLEERFASPKLDSFNQRLAARCYLSALNRTETQEYIRYQITAAGGHAALLFLDETCQTVFQATGGLPRLINQVCDHAMLLAYVAGRQQVTPADVEEAWSDLQQLPTPWNNNNNNQNNAASGVIEFGSLDDSPDAASPQNSAAFGDDSAATLPISATIDEHATYGGASQQIKRIEQLLAEADDFEPAGTIVPEVELQIEDTPHPFLEEFEHEEIITDRYSTKYPLAVPFASEPFVPPSKGVAEAPSPPAIAVTVAAQPSRPAAETPCVIHDCDDSACPSVTLSDDSAEFAPAAAVKVAEQAISAAVPAQLHVGNGPETCATPATMVLDDNMPETAPEVPRSAAARPQAARGHEFRRLFARLRRN